MRIRTVIPTIAVAVLLVAPSAAIACSVASPTVGSGRVPRDQLVVPTRASVARGDWGLHPTWLAERPQLIQQALVRGASRFGISGAAIRSQRTLTFVGSHTRGLRTWADDADPATTCAVAGQPVYSRSRLLVRETATEVHVVFVTRRAPVDSTGCTTSSSDSLTLPTGGGDGDPDGTGGDTTGGDVAFDPAASTGMGLDSCADVASGRITLRRPIGDRALVLDWFAPRA